MENRREGVGGLADPANNGANNGVRVIYLDAMST
jgi:hypothetical protein